MNIKKLNEKNGIIRVRASTGRGFFEPAKKEKNKQNKYN